MRNLLAAAVMIAGAAAAQSSGNPFDKPPADVDDALRARVNRFYQLQVNGQWRAAEALVAEDSQDDYYAMAKQNIFSFRVGDIRYSENYSIAKVTIVAKMEYQFAGMPKPEVTDIPFPSQWKIDRGQWCWQSRKDSRLAATPEQLAAMPTIETIQQAVKTDKKRVTLRPGGQAEHISLINGLPGAAVISLQPTGYPGLDVKLDRAELKAGEKAAVTVSAAQTAASGRTALQFIVQPVNTVLIVEVSIEKQN